MFKGKYFYNEGMRKMTIAFGQLFNNIVVQNKDKNGAIVKRVRVPLAYAPKEKFLVRLDQQANLDSREMAVTLPRLGFEISGLSYDNTRKLTKMQKFSVVKDGTTNYYNYMPVPYNISFNLYSFTATAENGLQIIEQILPYFQPDFTVTVNVIPDLNIKRDIPIVLNSISYEDSYSGDFTTRRAVIYTLNFTAKTYLYGPTSTAKVIKTSQSDLGASTDPILAREERIITVPNPTSADMDDDFGFTTTLSFFDDGKRYDPLTDTDK